ncbi:MAG: hypothetical protein WDM85_00135 [Caulobacteraceae bacterium]
MRSASLALIGCREQQLGRLGRTDDRRQLPEAAEITDQPAPDEQLGEHRLLRSDADIGVKRQLVSAWQRGAAMILISHDIGVIAEAADKVAIMYAGRLVELGPVREVLANPHHPYTVGSYRLHA